MFLLPRIRTWKAYGRMFTKPRVWAKAVAHVLRRHGLPAGPIRGTHPGTCAVFDVGKPPARVLVKFYPPMDAGDQVIERASLRAVGRALPVPRLVAAGVLRDRSTWRYIILRPLEGRRLAEVRGRMRRADRLAAARAAGRWLRRLHRIPAPAGVPPVPMRALARRAVARFRRARVFTPALLAELRRRLNAVAAAARRARTLLHADLYEDHLVMRRRAGRWRAAGFIDFADAAAGHPLYELMPVCLGLAGRDAGLVRAFLAGFAPGLRVTPAWRERAAAFGFIHEFAPPALLHRFKRDRVPTRSLDWPALRDWLLPPALEG